MLQWKQCRLGCHHVSTTTHHATITPYGNFAELLIWRRGESPKIHETFFRRELDAECADAPDRHWGCADPVADAKMWADKELSH